MKGLMLHCGGQPATLTEIGNVPMPIETDTYKPVNHRKLIEVVREITLDTLPVKLKQESFGLAKDGKHLFGHLTFTNGLGNDELGMDVGIVNSYDKILRVKIAAGATVFVCDNMMLSGSIQFMRKHTKNVWGDVEEMTKSHIGTLDDAYDNAVKASDDLKKIRITDEQVWKLLGMAYGTRLLTNPMMTTVRNEWEKPSFRQFKNRNAWSLYNAMTFALKKAQPRTIMEKHERLHKMFTEPDTKEHKILIGLA